MTTFARVVSGIALDCRVHATATELAACFHPDWLAVNPFVVVPDGTVHGAKDNGNGTFTNPSIPKPPAPQPNTPNNPYFGKKPMETKDFWALVGQTLAPDRLKRLLSDTNFIWVSKVLDSVVTVDPDDMAGQFVKIMGYLTATAGDDGKPLLETTERDAIMKAWK